MMSAFSWKKIAFFFVQKSTFTQSNSVRAFVRGFLALLSFFVRKKVNITENITSANSVSRIRPRDCSEFAKHPENNNDVIEGKPTLCVCVCVCVCVRVCVCVCEVEGGVEGKITPLPPRLGLIQNNVHQD